MTDALRIDKWLFYTRFYKTRALATAAVTGGHVTRNGERAKPANPVHVGDRLVITRERFTWRIAVVSIPARRGPASEAQGCYEETAESQAAREALAAALKSDRMSMPQTSGRPDKHTRRQLRAYKDRRD